MFSVVSIGVANILVLLRVVLLWERNPVRCPSSDRLALICSIIRLPLASWPVVSLSVSVLPVP